MPQETTAERRNRPSNKKYDKPVLRIYGRIEEVTHSVMTSSVGDNASHKRQNHKTGG